MAKRILFQGDSITDCGRARNNLFHLGDGYANLVKATLGFENPGEYEFINQGVSGNRIVDLYARIKSDFINLQPDYASVLIGTNDTWHEISRQNGVETEKFEKIYTMLIEEVLAACPNVKLMIFAPFIVEGCSTSNTEEEPNRFERFKVDIAEKIAAAKRVAEKFNLPCVDLQEAFDKACTLAPSEYWTHDGVHPTACGHEIIKRLWIETFEKIK